MNHRWDPEGTARGRVVLLHGIMSTAATWWRVGPALASRGWVVDALDLPGHGDWPRSDRPLGMDSLVDGIAAADTAALAAGLRAELAWDLPAMVAAVRVPLLVLAAGTGAGLGEAGGSALHGPDREAVRALLPPDRFVMLDCGHCLHRDLPGRWLEVVDGFADAVLGPGPSGQPGPGPSSG
jgi:pimeloyl-ACP methyl ester carboxylesterase